MEKSTSYHGVKRKGKAWEASIIVDGEFNYLGRYYDQKLAAKAYDFFVVRNGLNRKTNSLKKKLAQTE